MEPLRPVIIKDLASSWPASRNWTLEYFREKYGKLHVKVQMIGIPLSGSAINSGGDCVPAPIRTPKQLAEGADSPRKPISASTVFDKERYFKRFLK